MECVAAGPVHTTSERWVVILAGRRRLVLSLILITAVFCEGCATTSLTQNANRIVIIKSTHTMTLMNNGQALKSYRVALGKGDAAPKERRGDQRTPEGEYVVDEKKDVTCCFLALHISYPNSSDVERARMLGVDPGDAIEIHGLPRKRAWLGRFHRMVDWTAGCIAVTNSEMAEIWLFVPLDTPVEIHQ